MSKYNYAEAIKELKHVGDWLRWAASCLQESEVYFGHGTETAWDEAVTLVLQLLHLPSDVDRVVMQSRVTTTERRRLAEAIRQRIEERKPLPYITKRVQFMGLEFYVDERVLIPRSPFAEWIERQFSPWIDPERVERLLEIGTGSGCLAIAAALAFPLAEVDAVDVSSEALEVASINVKKYALEDRVHLILSDGFKQVTGQYDIIFSNPPYVGAEEMSNLPPEYLHEPRSALEADDDGLALVLSIIEQAAQHLTEQGILVVEVGNSEQQLVERLPEVPFVWLEQEHGGHGFFMLTKQQLEKI